MDLAAESIAPSPPGHRRRGGSRPAASPPEPACRLAGFLPALRSCCRLQHADDPAQEPKVDAGAGAQHDAANFYLDRRPAGSDTLLRDDGHKIRERHTDVGDNSRTLL